MGQSLTSLANHQDDNYHHPMHSINEDVPNLMSSGHTVKVQKISVVRNSVNLRRQSLGLIYYENDIYLIKFLFDALYDVEVTISFCCLEQMTDTHEPIFTPTKYKTIKKIFPKKVNSVYMSTPDEAINLKQMNINDLKWKPSYESVVPILITLRALGTDIPQVQFTLAYLQENEIKGTQESNLENQYKIIIYRQKIQIGKRILEMKEIFGIEKPRHFEVDPVANLVSGRECVICLSAERNTVVLPCRHMCLCEMCTNMVRLQTTKCPICRQTVMGFLQFTFDNKTKLEQLQLPNSV